VQILGSLDGIETGVRQLIRDVPLETMILDYRGERLTVPTEGEILRIKGVLILKRNATRDYLDFVALAHHMGDQKVAQALLSFDKLYRQDNGESALQQLQVQLANTVPYDLNDVLPELPEYKNLAPQWHDWDKVRAACAHISTVIFDRVCDLLENGPTPQ
jgi:predicted nucleotidyltransferase component of viral defense system